MTAIPAHSPAVSPSAIGTTQRNARLVRTTAALLSVQGITWLAALIEILIVPRSLGTSDYGLMSTSVQVAQVLLLVGTFGTSKFIVREVARNPDEGRRIILSALALRLTLWFGIALLALAVLPFVVGGLTARIVFVVVMAGSTLALMAEAGYAGLQGNQSLGAAALTGAVVGIATQLVLAGVLLLGGDVVAATVVAAAGTAASATIMLILVGRQMSGPISFGVRDVTGIAAGSVAFLAWDLGHRIYGSAGLIMVAALTDAATAGHLAFATRISGIPIFVTTAVAAGLFPALSATAHSDREWFKSTLTQSARLVLVATVPMALGLIVLAPEITGSLSGGKFGDSSIPLTILAVSIPAIAVHSVIGTGLFARDRHRLMGVVAWVAAGSMVVMNMIAIPVSATVWGNGAIGASVVALLVELLVGSVLWILIWNDIRKRALLWALARAVLASALMALVAIAVVRVAGLWAAIPAGALAYGGAGLLLRVFTLAEVRELLGGLRRSGA